MPRLFNIFPIEATEIPLPTELTTPPVTKIYLLTACYKSMEKVKSSKLIPKRRSKSGLVPIIKSGIPDCQVSLVQLIPDSRFPAQSRIFWARRNNAIMDLVKDA